MIAPVFYDNRWNGRHGIGRYAAEIVARIEPEPVSLGLSGSPSLPLAALKPLTRAQREGLVYSPGYSPLLRAKHQLLTVHDLIHVQTPGSRQRIYAAYYNRVIRPIVRRNKAVITDSQSSVDLIRAWLRDDDVDVVNAGIGCSEHFSVDGPKTESVDPYMVYVGNLRAHKNFRTVLGALSKVPGLHLHAVLPVGDVPEARKYAEEVGVAARTVFLSGVTDESLAEEYRGAVATVMPSLLEGFGLPPLESIKCGTPVIWWKGCAVVGETVGDRGVAVDASHDVDAWASAMWEELAGARRVTPPAADLYSWSNTAKTVSDEIRRMRERAE